MTNYKETKQQAHKFFQQNKKVPCPALNGEIVVFNSRGLSHLFYKGSRKVSKRPSKETKVRILLLPRALKVIQKATFYQEASSYTDKNKKIYYYYAFEAVVDEKRIKVIVRQIGKGNKHFWSVIPAWRRARGKIINAKSDLSKI